jgi:glutaredoxin
VSEPTDIDTLEAWAERGAIEYHDLAIGHEFHWACPWCHNGDAHQAAAALIARVRELEELNEERKKYTFDQEQVLEYAEGEHAHVARLTAALQQVSLENADAHHDAAAWKEAVNAAVGSETYPAIISREAHRWIVQRHDSLIDREQS